MVNKDKQREKGMKKETWREGKRRGENKMSKDFEPNVCSTFRSLAKMDLRSERRWSNMSEALRSFLKSAEPARTMPATLTLSFVMKFCTASSATFLT